MSDVTRTTVRQKPVSQQPQEPHDEVLLGRYRVLARRGTGGFGVVCTCWDTRLQRRVAIKRLPIFDETGTTTAEEALAEARTACMLAHPNIVAVYDFEIEGPYAYLVMEYVDGLNLAELLARVEGGRLMPEECAWILASVGRALSFAHENRVLHLDIKPTNIMIDRQGTVKLADFGMSTLASAAGYGDARGGTIGYMPPEQIKGELVDERADVFSLAVVVWQALTGENPFAATSASESLKKIVHGPAKPLSRTYHELAGAPEEALLRALSPSVAERTASVGELENDLLPYMGNAREGAASLRSLVGQSEDDESTQATTWSERHLPLNVRFPWLESAVERVASAIVTCLVTYSLFGYFAGFTSDYVWIGAIVSAAATAVWPPLGSALVTAMLAWLVATTVTTMSSYVAAIIIIVALGAWWVLIGRKEDLASFSLLLPCCLSEPAAAAGVSGFALDPLPATVTAVAGHLLGSLLEVASLSGFSTTALLPALASEWGTLTFWISVLGSALCGFVSSAVAMRGTVASGIAGQLLGLGCIVCAQSVVAGMENGGMWGVPDWHVVAFAVWCTVFLCIATVLRGPLYDEQEG